jgi:hypothetical protein
MTPFSSSRFLRPATAILALLAVAPAFLSAGGPPAAGAKAKGAVARSAPKPFISLAPSVVMLQGKTGESFRRTLQMTNGTPIPLTFRMMAMDVVVQNGKREFVPAGEMPGSIAATAVFSPQEITIQPHQSGSVNVTMTVPQQTAIRAVVVEFRGMNPIATAFKTRATATASLGALVTFSLSGNVQIDVSPLKITAQSPTTNAAITTWLQNTGSDPGIVKGEAAILSQTGTLSAKAPITEQRLLPGEHLPFKAELPVELQPGRYRAFATFLCAGQTITETANFEVR